MDIAETIKADATLIEKSIGQDFTKVKDTLVSAFTAGSVSTQVSSNLTSALAAADAEVQVIAEKALTAAMAVVGPAAASLEQMVLTKLATLVTAKLAA